MSKAEKAEKLEKPLITDSAWHDYVMGQFSEEETVEDPHSGQKVPTLPGLRRVTELLVGQVTGNEVTLLAQPSEFNGRAYVVGCSLTIKGETGSIVVQALADAHWKNADPPYNKYLSAIAESRAEARAFRKALKIRTVSAEELSNVAENQTESDEWEPSANLARSQEAIINKLCQQMDIDAWAFLNSGSDKYPAVKDVTYSAAQRMIQQLNIYRKGDKQIPSSLKGYKDNWNKDK